jgi:outer membrane lipoprotein-sorting protein
MIIRALFKSAKFPLLALLLSTTVTPFAHAATGDELLHQVDRNLQPDSYEMYRKLIKGQDKMVALFLDPPSEKGRASLRLGDNMWLYIPNVGKPLRITSLQSVVGGVFNNSDILRLDYSTEYNVTSMTTDAGQTLLELKAKSKSVAYDRLKMWVDKKNVIPVKIEAYAASGLLIKTLHYSKITDFGGGLKRPAMLETDSPLYKGYKSVMLFSNIKKRKFADEVFTLNYLPRIESLR